MHSPATSDIVMQASGASKHDRRSTARKNGDESVGIAIEGVTSMCGEQRLCKWPRARDNIKCVWWER
jgi:hypothetical protein